MSRDVWAKKRANANDDNGWGGYMAAKVSKLDEQFKLDAPREKQKDGASSNIFSGVAVYVNGYTEPSADELRRLMMLHGGQFHTYYSRSRTTHIIANNLPNSKIQELKGEKVIRPEWITDSIKAGRLLPYLQYQLYAKQKGSLFAGMNLRQTSEIVGPSHGLPQHSINQKLYLPQRSIQHSVPNTEQSPSSCQSNSIPNSTPQVLKEAPMTNGHTHLINGALKAGDLSLFPHSPPNQSEQATVIQEQSSLKDVNERGPKASPPTYQEAQQAKETPQPSPWPSCDVDSRSEKSLSHSPIRLNGSHHNAFSFDPASLNTNNLTAKTDPSTDKTSSSKSSAQLLAQTDNLISEFYSHSRLHQISTWRTGFSEYVNELHSKRRTVGTVSFPGKDRLRRNMSRCFIDSQGNKRNGFSSKNQTTSCILHVDMDCFFVSVGIRHRPELKGKPVAVTSNRGQGKVPLRPGANPQLEKQYYERKQIQAKHEDLHRTPSQESPGSCANGVDQDAAALSMAEIASCSYEARQAGVRNGMFFGKAKQLCPSLQSVPYDFEAYKEVALTMYEILAGYTHDIEALSCDEVLIDGSALVAELGISPDDLASAIRAEIKEKTGCCASVGMGSNILLARLATRKAKPDGQHFLKSEEVDDFIRDLSVTSLPGVGPVMGRKLAAIGVRSCGDLQQVSLFQLQKKFGPRTGQTLFRFCRGLDDRPVRYEKERKSVSAEMNYNIRFTKVDEAECFLNNLSMEVQKRLQEAGLRGRRVTLKVMVRKMGAPLEPAKYGGHGICDNLAKTVMLAQSTDSGQLIAAAVIKLFHSMNLQVQDLRGVGIQVQLLEGHHSVPQDSRTRSIKDMLLGQRLSTRSSNKGLLEKTSCTTLPSSPSAEPVPGTSKGNEACKRTPKHSQSRLNLSIEVPSPSQVDRSVLEALPTELREQVENSWARSTSPPHLPPGPALYAPPAGTLILQIPNQPGSPGIVLELPNYSQVDPDVFAALPKELQEELKSAYSRVTNAQPQAKMSEPKNPLMQLKQSGIGIGRAKRRYKRKNAVSPVKKGPSPQKRRPTTNSPAKNFPSPVKPKEPRNIVKVTHACSVPPQTENGPSTSSSKQDLTESVPKIIPRCAPTLAGACDLTDIKTLLREWVTTITEPMEEDILQVVKYCTDLIEDKDLEKLDLIIKYMKRIMQQSVESVWSMAFDFIVDNIQVVVQQTYGSTLKIA
uniref:DNA repair protein REV1 n=1 Tax=Sphaeramia orbicularis TaxID=375764 RepID=A0A672Z6B3_9TELE